MGHQLIMYAVVASMFLSAGVLTFVQNWNASTNATSTQFEQQQALNVSSSGVALALSKLRNLKTWRAGFSNQPIANGRCTLTVTDIGKDSVRIVSNGTFGNATHQSIVRAKLFSVFPVVESALTVYGDSVNFASAGKAFSVDGRDYLEDGTTLGTGDPVYGLGVSKDKIITDVKKTLEADGISANVNGKGGSPSVGLFTNKEILDSLHVMYRSLATLKLPSGSYTGNATFGTMTTPEIVHVPGNLLWNGTISGCGILVVDGDLIMKGTITWKGIIIALSADIELSLGGYGTPNLLGTTFIGNNAPGKITRVKLNGDPYIRYSYSVLQNVLAKLNLLQVEIISYYE